MAKRTASARAKNAVVMILLAQSAIAIARAMIAAAWNQTILAANKNHIF